MATPRRLERDYLAIFTMIGRGVIQVLSMDKDSLLCGLSALAQTSVALVAFVGAIALFRVLQLKSGCDEVLDVARGEVLRQLIPFTLTHLGIILLSLLGFFLVRFLHGLWVGEVLFGLLSFGAVIPTATMFRKIRQAPPAKAFKSNRPPAVRWRDGRPVCRFPPEHRLTPPPPGTPPRPARRCAPKAGPLPPSPMSARSGLRLR